RTIARFFFKPRNGLHQLKSRRVLSHPFDVSEKELDFLATLPPNRKIPQHTLLLAANTLYMSGRFGDAIALLKASSDNTARMAEGWFLLFLDQHDRAAELFSDLACDEKLKTEALKYLSLAYYLQGKLDEALKCLTA